jgi:hypothetical protein
VPSHDVPLLDVPTFDVPLLDVPTFDVPLLDVPTFDVPLLDVPSHDVLLLDVPTFDVPPLDVPCSVYSVVTSSFVNTYSSPSLVAHWLPFLPSGRVATPPRFVLYLALSQRLAARKGRRKPDG